MGRVLDIIIPTYNNQEIFDPCVASIIKSGVLTDFARLIIINNGSQDIDTSRNGPSLLVIKPGKNLGWEGGIKLGVEHSDAEFVCFQNDDTFVPKCSDRVYHKMVAHFSDPTVGAVGPVSNAAFGWQSIFRPDDPRDLVEVPYLIFFTVVVRRTYLDEVGGVDPKLPGGDDIDVSMRLRLAGYKLLVDPDLFVFHHGFVTGERVYGPPEIRGGWNSPKMTEMIHKALIQKHGYEAFVETANAQAKPYRAPGGK